MPLSLPPAQTSSLEGDYSNDPTIRRLVRDSNEQVRALSKLESGVRRRLRKNINPGAGRGGSGSGGGKDTGKDKGNGRGQGQGQPQASLNQRAEARAAPGMTFNTLNGTDYLNQLHGLGAIVAFPLPGGQRRFKVIRDLKNPASAREESIEGINRIYWVDDKAASVQSLFSGAAT